MMGQLPNQQNELFYDFCLEKHIPEDHLLRRIDQFLDFDPIKAHLRPYYSSTGRPSIDPELMIRMLLIGYCYGIRSERRLCEEVHFNLAYRWFCKLGLEDEVPNHSSFSKNRHGRFRESDLLRFIFDAVVQQCDEQGLIKGEGFATDASYVRADASWEHCATSIAELIANHSQSRAVNEYLAALDNDSSLVAEQKRISLTDPLSRWMQKGGPARFYYCTNYMIDTDHNIILDVEATPTNKVLEVDSSRKMIDRIEEKLSIKPQRLMADAAYGDAQMLGWLVEEKNIEPHIPVWDKSAGDPTTFKRTDFTWEAENNCYVCPAGKLLQHGMRKLRGTGITKNNTKIYRASMHDCKDCNLKPQCCPNTNSRKIARSIHEDSRDIARAISKTDAYKQSFRERKKVEVLFGHLKRIMNLDRLRLRGLSGASDEFLLAATVQNLRALAKWRSKPPNHRIGAPVWQ